MGKSKKKEEVEKVDEVQVESQDIRPEKLAGNPVEIPLKCTVGEPIVYNGTRPEVTNAIPNIGSRPVKGVN